MPFWIAKGGQSAVKLDYTFWICDGICDGMMKCDVMLHRHNVEIGKTKKIILMWIG